MVPPDVDIIIPTFNSGNSIGRCLEQIKKQQYGGKINVTIIDGGSTDNTIDIASDFNAHIEIKKWMYATGKNGARHYGENITSSPFVWNIDSDNILVEESVLRRLIQPMLRDPTINISIPFPSIDHKTSTFNQWLTLKEIERVMAMVDAGTELGNSYILLNDMFYGLTNCSLVRRSAIEAVGGYDSDVRLLSRMRRMKMSRGIIDVKSHFYHNQTASILNFFKKWDRRIKFFGSMTQNDLEAYFVEYPPLEQDDNDLKAGFLASILSDTIGSLFNFVKSGNRSWLWGLPYSIWLLSYFALHPMLSYKVFTKFL